MSEHQSKAPTFLFDIIVTRLQLTKEKVDDPSKLIVNLKFNNIPMSITPSRINVTDFKAGRQSAITCDPEILRQGLEAQGLPMTVRYSGKPVGTATLKFPQSFVDRIQDGMSDLYHQDSCTLVKRDVVAGTLEVFCSLIIKCETLIETTEPCKKSCTNLGKAIKEADIMFLIGSNDPCESVCEPCAEQIETEEGDERLRMDLNRYRGDNERATLPPTENYKLEATSLLKAMADQCGLAIDSVMKKVNKLPKDELIFTDWSRQQTPFTQKYVDRTISVPLGDIEVMGIKPIRFCPVCLTSMSCLPKYAPCPKCDTKAMPKRDLLSEKPLTADQIINQCLRQPKKQSENFCEDPCAEPASDEKEKENENILGPVPGAGEGCPKVEPNENEDFCVIVEPNQLSCSPYLERVFAELRDLYKKRDEKKAAQLNKHCAQNLLQLKLSQNSSHMLTQKSSTGAIVKVTGSPTFMHRMPHGPKIGHKTCLRQELNVSRRHGWAWPSTKKARKYGWRPGAICRYAGAVMRFFLCSAENNAFNTCQEAEEDERSIQPSILNMRKKNGAIYITLRAVNSPHMEMKPIVFKIVKSDLAVALREIKKKLKQKGFPKCVCHKSVMMCVCRDAVDKKHLARALQKECKLRRMESCIDRLILTDTSESEMEFNFDVTPPLAVGKPQLAIKPRTFTLSTQTDEKDKIVPPLYPTELDPYWRVYDCAAGDRYTGTAFGKPGEVAFEDGLFGHGGGGPHGASGSPGGRPKLPGIWGSGQGGPMRGGARGGAGGVGGGRGGPGGMGGLGGIGGGRGGKDFPGGKKKPQPTPFIPVRMPKRHVEGVKRAIQAEKDAVKNEIARRKKGIDLMKYLMKDGAIPTPWNPNEPKPEVKSKVKTGPVVGADGLTDAQRKRKALNQVCAPPFDSLAKLGKGIDPCINQCYYPCANQCYNPCVQYCNPCPYYC
ncbi:uncharacterized protein LOC115564782 [Drosophila navojoa]|uniref:uncharacterized protein LOC115564782 n=1 Tax=Drosophila navojoa TaxID=7232 RepID=UPI0011BF1F5F|nr:uncharacterized protein LOC115564782 [Drosophila navojoa]